MEKLAVKKSRFKHDGLYHLGSFYNLLYDVIRGMGYDVEETKYKRRLNADGSQAELVIKWKCFKPIDDYAGIELIPEILIVGMGKQQTQIDGKPVTKDSGVVELALSASVVLDYKNQWAANPFLSFLRTHYDKYFYKSVVGGLIGKGIDEMNATENEMKAFFNMQTFM